MTMKLIEAMKGLKLVEKKIEGNIADISKYSSMLSSEKPYFSDETMQRQEVAQRVQANQDLVRQYLNLKTAIELTNLRTPVTLGKATYTIAELLVLKRKLGQYILKTYQALNDANGETRLRSLPRGGQEGQVPQVVRLYDEKKKNESLRYWQDLLEEISGRLEVVNATTDLAEVKA